MNEPRIGSVAYVYRTDKSHLRYFNHFCPGVLNEDFLMNTFCSNEDGHSEELIITKRRVLFTSNNKKVYFGARPPILVQKKAIKQIEVSLLHFTEHQGFVSTKKLFFVLNFVTNDHRKFERNLFIGSTEAEKNRNYPKCLEIIENFSKYFDVIEVGEYESSGGYTTSFGLGIFKPLE